MELWHRQSWVRACVLSGPAEDWKGVCAQREALTKAKPLSVCRQPRGAETQPALCTRDQAPGREFAGGMPREAEQGLGDCHGPDRTCLACCCLRLHVENHLMGSQRFSSPAFLLHRLASSVKESLSSSTLWLQTWFVQEGHSTKSWILLLVHIFIFLFF